jgi:GNAT superfamily N-acetyltransferase
VTGSHAGSGASFGAPTGLPSGAALEAALDPGLRLPDGHRLVTLAEDPALRAPMGDHNVAVWPEFMLHDPVADRLWDHLFGTFAAWQACLLGPTDRIEAALNAAPLPWTGRDGDLPAGWDDQFERSVDAARSGIAPTTLGAIQIVVRPERQGDGLSGLMVGTMRAMARLAGLRWLIACVRPTLKARYPLIPIERYARWARPDGLPFDPWIRLHARMGGRIVRGVPDSMTITGTVAEWEAWTEMAFPESGDYVVPGAASAVRIERESDLGTYLDPNVWMVHRIDGVEQG